MRNFTTPIIVSSPLINNNKMKGQQEKLKLLDQEYKSRTERLLKIEKAKKTAFCRLILVGCIYIVFMAIEFTGG